MAPGRGGCWVLEHLQKPMANIILNGEKNKAFPLTSGTGQGYPLLLLALAKAKKIRQARKISFGRK